MRISSAGHIPIGGCGSPRVYFGHICFGKSYRHLGYEVRVKSITLKHNLRNLVSIRLS